MYTFVLVKSLYDVSTNCNRTMLNSNLTLIVTILPWEYCQDSCADENRMICISGKQEPLLLWQIGRDYDMHN